MFSMLCFNVTFLHFSDGGYNNNNNSRRNAPNGPSKAASGGEEEGSVGSTGSVTSTGTQDEEEETRLLALSEMLSAIVSPTVSHFNGFRILAWIVI